MSNRTRRPTSTAASVAATDTDYRDPGHDIVVIGASCGGIQALTAIVAMRPSTIDTTFSVPHASLNDVSSLLAWRPSTVANEGQPFVSAIDVRQLSVIFLVHA